MSNKLKVHFPGLNGLRFFAAFAVIITHIELIKSVFGYKNMWRHPLVFNLGGLGVVFFFVLSGFLITYLLFTEKNNKGTISVKAFYIRRIFRIWPLYYLITLIGFFLLPKFSAINIPYLEKSFQSNYWQELLLYVVMLPNLAFAMYQATPHIGQAWSIGVEEQFYLTWPWFIKYVRNPFWFFFILIFIIIITKAIVVFLATQYPLNESIKVIKSFVAMSKFECMSIGALGAFALIKKKHFLKWAFHPFIHFCSWIFIPFLIFFTPAIIQDGMHIVYSILFIVIILNVAANPHSFINLNYAIFDFLGNISYGIYMYHLFLIPIILINIRFFFIHLPYWGWNILLYFLVLLITIIVAALSYYLFEIYFLKLKKKFTLVQSG